MTLLLAAPPAGSGRAKVDWWFLAPAALGIVGAAFRIRFMPALVLVVVAAILMVQEALGGGGFGGRAGLVRTFNGSLPDWLLSAAMLAYVAAHYRLMGLARAYFPDDPDHTIPRAAGESADGDEERGGRTAASPMEMSWFVISLPVWAVLAQVVWRLVQAGPPRFGLDPAPWQGVVLAWALGLGCLLVGGVLSYAAWQHRTRSEAKLLLQDIMWRENARELRRIERALALARRRQRRKERS
jgi:hypothetical protein